MKDEIFKAEGKRQKARGQDGRDTGRADHTILKPITYNP